MGRRRAGRDEAVHQKEFVGRVSDTTEPYGHLGRALALTFASALVWGVAHLSAGRRLAGGALMALYAALIAGLVVAGLTVSKNRFEQIAVQHTWLDSITIGIIVLALIWATIVLRSYQVLRPDGLAVATRIVSGALVAVFMVLVCTPLVWAAHYTHVYRSALTTVFHGDHNAKPIDTDNPWKNTPRINVLLLGGDGAGDRTGIRTDSITVASINTTTGNTVMLGVPRNLQDVPMPPRLHSQFPDHFTGDAPNDQGLINEIYQYAEDHPSVMPGYPKGERGPELDSQVVGHLLGIKIDYYIVVNLFGFADIVNAVGGVKIRVAQDIPYGGPEDGSAPTGVIKAGYRKLNGYDALWYGRSRTASDDFARMARQKCLLRAIAQQADPQKVLSRFEQIAAAVQKTVSTNIPPELLPALVKLSGTMKHGADIRSLLFVPPLINTGDPNVALMRRLTATAIAENDGTQPPSASPSTSPSNIKKSPSTGSNGDPNPGQGKGPQTKPVSLSAACP
jgi:LCP family protein required for cell wall assembly